ncbi:MAG: hypothetical protein ACQXXG_09940 [Candidatus Bathyarchaeia archaeon]|jgi:hypothetical protein
MSKKVVLGKERILDRWSVLVDGAKGNGGEVIEKTVKYIEASKAPDLKLERVRVFPPGGWKFLSRFFKRYDVGREYLRVVNEELGKIDMYVGAVDYGENLYVSWYLAVEAGIFDRLFPKEKMARLRLGTDILVEEELNAYVTCIHHCLLKAVKPAKSIFSTSLAELFAPPTQPPKSLEAEFAEQEIWWLICGWIKDFLMKQ